MDSPVDMKATNRLARKARRWRKQIGEARWQQLQAEWDAFVPPPRTIDDHIREARS